MWIVRQQKLVLWDRIISVNLLNCASKMFQSMIFSCSVHRRSQGSMIPQMFSISSNFLLWEAASQTKILLLAKIQIFCPSENFLAPQKFWAGYATSSVFLLNFSNWCFSLSRYNLLERCWWTQHVADYSFFWILNNFKSQMQFFERINNVKWKGKAPLLLRLKGVK